MTNHTVEAVDGPSDVLMTNIVDEEERVLQRVLRHIASRNVLPSESVDYDQELIELRDEIGEARLEDVPALVAQMERLQAVAERRAKVSEGHVDVQSPYFGRIVLKEGDRKREVLIGRSTYLDPNSGVHIVDWRDAPVSRLYYRYDEGDDYDEVFGTRPIEGEVLTRRSLAIVQQILRRVGSPHGTFLRDRKGRWFHMTGEGLKLEGGQGSAMRPEQHRRPNKLGIDVDGEGREDKYLPEIAALIDPHQFELITRPESGLVVIQGGAGSGKTTIGLHRMAYLAFQRPKRFRPDRMLVIAFNDALTRYISRVLPALGVDGVPSTTFQRWARKRRMRHLPLLPNLYTDGTPSVVVRLKKHPVMLRIIDERVDRIQRSITRELEKALQGLKGANPVLKFWRESKSNALTIQLNDLVKRFCTQGEKGSSSEVRHTLDRTVKKVVKENLDVVGIWAELLTDRGLLSESLNRLASGEFTGSELETVLHWNITRCTLAINEVEERADGQPRRRTTEEDGEESDVGVDGQSEQERAKLDWEDNALLLRIIQRVSGPLRGNKDVLRYEHIFIDEAQDLSPVELAIVLDTVHSKSVTLAGDVAQRLYLDNGFSDWKNVLDHLGLSHVELEPLELSYRSTFEIIEFANHVLGHLVNPQGGKATRHGVPVELFRFVHTGDAVGFLAEALRELAHSEPLASVAIISRFSEQADIYYQGLLNAEVPNLRRIVEQDFPFKAGVDVTDVRQVKGLEFDYVVLVEVTPQSYGVDDESRHLLHIAASRAAHQLWILATGTPSLLLPDDLREREY